MCTLRCRAQVRPDSVLTERAGRGANFGYGYNGTDAVDGAADVGTTVERAVEAAQAEAERCWGPMSFIVVHSLAGGTGSGLGARLIENLRAACPVRFIATVSVAPFSDGETPVQSYNTVLCASVLQRHADIVMLFSNDALLAAATAAAGGNIDGGGSATRRVSFDDMNKVLATCVRTMANHLADFISLANSLPGTACRSRQPLCFTGLTMKNAWTPK